MKQASLKALVTSLMLASAVTTPALAVSTPAAKVSAQQANAAKLLKKLADDFYLSNARYEPMLPTLLGDSRFDDQLGTKIWPATRAQRRAEFQKFTQRLHAIDATKLSVADRINYDILDYSIKAEVQNLQFPNHLLPINQMDGMPSMLANLADGKSSQPIATVPQYRAFLSRIKQLTPWIDQAIANMREGIKTGVVLPKALIAAALPQHQQLATKSAESSPFYAAIKELPATISDADKCSLTQAYKTEIDQHLNPALARLATFLEKEYLPAGRATAGLGALPNGAQWYQEELGYNTTTTLTPDAIHALGLVEVARIQQQFAELGPKLGYDGPAAGLPKWISEQPRFKPFKNEQEILDVYRKLDVTLGPKLSAIFTLLPKAPLEQRLEPELTRATASDHYTPPSVDGKRPGVFWSVVNDATAYDSPKMTSLYMHEGRPGHHFQLALQLEQPLPDFRRFGFNNAYVEGWALYAESLGKELGVLDDPAQYFGHLNEDLLRAARLVVDTGLHAKGWTREQAISYLRDTNGYTDAVATSAIERYMAWPGQATSYKVGALKISELRQRAATALGPKFKLADFHALVLGDGSLPLAVLEQKVDRWIAESK